MKSITNVPFYAFLAATVVVLAGCSGGPGASSGDNPPTTLAEVPSAPVIVTADAADAREADLDAFCELGLQMLLLVEQEFVGSDEHVAQFTALGEVAPDDLVEHIANLEEHYDVAVSPSDPDSQKYENFPASIQGDANELVTAIETRCDASE
ncbi:hypothetical protein LGT39_10495 [Demequina sp. TTPB684]|uniref:hypothetical protein n=1 Tax=unclassified Demequina TaxID=2620311 RepID=UPI001CF2296A|nr:MULTISPECIES: hypothetical protein [unclassified Demequina]MCB2413271.1 hypothetical protein [Demequina sp. TTPB684]UPU88731.1 hypothetical protein LGT36_002065 [Demequina sp. TMPB413]